MSLSFDNKSYNSYGNYLRARYGGKKVFKVSVDAGFTCPNRDGTKGYGGCTYCNVDSFTPAITRENPKIKEQLEKNMEYMSRRYGAEKFIVYFQPNTNTYAPVDELKSLFDEALGVNPEHTVGLSVGTRCDCLDEEKLQLLESYADRVEVDLEIGMESMYDETLGKLNRGHSHQDFLEIMDQCRERAFKVCVHTIFGLPGENLQMMMAVADELNSLPIHFAKLHHLYIVEGSVMGVLHKRDPFQLFTLEEYTDFLCNFIPKLRPDLILQRLFGISDYKYHIAPNWGLKKTQLVNHLDKVFRERGVVQGSSYREPSLSH